MNRVAFRVGWLMAALLSVGVSQVSSGGVVQLAGSPKNSTSASGATVAGASVGSEAPKQTVDRSAQKLSALDDSPSDWVALLDAPARAELAAAPIAQQPARTTAGGSSSSAAVIPLPPAVWSGLATLGAAGWVALRSRGTKHSSRSRRLPAFDDR